MKYLVFSILVINTFGLRGMHADQTSKAQKIASMKEWIQTSKKVLEEHPEDLPNAQPVQQQPEKVVLSRKKPVYPSNRSGSPTVLLKIIQEDQDRQIAGMEKLYKESLEVVTMLSNARDERMISALDRQADTILNLNELIKRLVSNDARLERRVDQQEQGVAEFKQDADKTTSRLLDAVSEQAQMFVSQNQLISELMGRVEKLTHKNTEQARKYALQSMALKKLQVAVEELTQKYTEQQIDELLEYFNTVLKELPDLKKAPIQPESLTDAELHKFLFSDDVQEKSNQTGEYAVFTEPIYASAYDPDDKGNEEMETIIIEEYVED